MKQGPWYKVLVNGRSANGGDMAWSLPTKKRDGSWKPGKWHEHNGPLAMCSAGFHLTNDPPEWWQAGCEVYEAEYEGEALDEGTDMICVRLARLLRRVEDTSEVRIYGPGEWQHTAGKGIALAGSRVEAWGSSHVKAWGSSHVEAWESSHVKAWGSSHVEAWESSHVEAWESSHVVARESSHVKAWGSSHVVARDTVLVSTPVHAWGEPTVKVGGHAIYIDQRGAGKLYAVTVPEIVVVKGDA